MNKTKLRELKIDSDTLLELIKGAVSRGELNCEGLSPSVKVHQHGEYQHYCGNHNVFTGEFGLMVEAEDEVPMDGLCDYIPLLRVERVSDE